MKPRSPLWAGTQILVLTGILVLLASACVRQRSSDSRIDVGGYRLHVHQSGSGTPVVIFESGMGEDLSTWKDVQPEVATLTSTLSYDRAGLGQSEPSTSSRPRDTDQLALELRTLLKATKQPGPYVLVGHSLGGAVIQVFAHAYPSEAAGLVLVDPGDGRLDALLRVKLPADTWSARQKALEDEMPKIPLPVRREYEALNLSGDEASGAFPLPAIPVILLTGTQKNPEFPGNPIEQDLKRGLHDALAAKVPGIKHVLVPESRHYIQTDAPERVIAAIRDVIGTVRAAQSTR